MRLQKVLCLFSQCLEIAVFRCVFSHVSCNMDLPRKLILHFDLNGTILMQDSAAETPLEQMLCEILATHAWGTVLEKEETKVWKLGHDTLSLLCPAEGLISYQQFTRLLHPIQTPETEPDEAKRAAMNKEIKLANKKLISEFCQHGKPGFKFKSLFDKMLKQLSLPKVVCEEFGFGQEDRKDPHPLHSLFANAKTYLIPGFFRTIMALKKAKRDFAVLFRTFGRDVENVAFEFTQFCEGNHPCYNGRNGCPLVRFDGLKGTKDLRIDEKNSGYFVRTSPNTDDAALVTGTFGDPSVEGSPEEVHSGAIDEGRITVYRTGPSIAVAISEMLLGNASFALRDDWPFWETQGQQADCGKLLLLDPSDYTTQHIFFDDSIEENDAKCIDVRNLVNGEVLPYKKTVNKYIVRVDSYRAITEADYFMKQIEACELARTEEITRLEAGIDSDTEEREEEVDQWAQFQQAKTSDYLNRAIFPVLLPALQVLNIERPEDPASFLAYWVLRHKDRVQLPSKPSPSA